MTKAEDLSAAELAENLRFIARDEGNRLAQPEREDILEAADRVEGEDTEPEKIITRLDIRSSLEELFRNSAPYVDGSSTSYLTAQQISAYSPNLRTRVLAFLMRRGGHGATDEEIQDALDMNPSTERPRRVELVDAGFVRDSGETRPTHSGNGAVVWEATEDAYQIAEDINA